MNRKIYIASGLANYKRVLDLRDKLIKYGIELTYDWAEVFKKNTEYAIDTGTSIKEDLVTIAAAEYKAVVDCELLLFVSPGGRGTHFELGVAYSNKKPIIIFYDDDCEPLAFHLLPGIERVHFEDKAIQRILSILKIDTV